MEKEYNMPSITHNGEEWIRVVDHVALLEKARQYERYGWKGWMIVDEQAGNYNYTRPFLDKNEAKEALRQMNIRGLSVVDVDIILTPTKTDKTTEV